MKTRLLSLLALAAVAAGLLFAQEIATPVADGANESVTLKKRIIVSSFVVERNANVAFIRERVSQDNSTNQIVTTSRIPPTYRVVNAVLADSVTAGTKTVTFQQFLDLAGKFEEKWRAEDEAIAAAKKVSSVRQPSKGEFFAIGEKQPASDGVNTMTYMGGGVWSTTLVHRPHGDESWLAKK